MGDRVAVLKDGYLQQVDTPQNLYDRPDNVFVAAFIGSPSMNLYEGDVARSAADGVVGRARFADGRASARRRSPARPGLRARDGQTVIVGHPPGRLRGCRAG